MDTVPAAARRLTRPTRTERLSLRLTPVERAQLELRAAQHGVTLSEWLRGSLWQAASDPQDPEASP